MLATAALRRLDDGLLALRSLFLTYVAGSCWLAVTGWLASRHPFLGHHADPALALALLSGCAGVVALVAVVRSRMLRSDDAAAAARTYRNRFLFGMSLAETAALAGFGVVWASGHIVFYVAGWVPALAGFALIAPTAADVAGCQRRLAAAGFDGDFGRALRRPFL